MRPIYRRILKGVSVGEIVEVRVTGNTVILAEVTSIEVDSPGWSEGGDARVRPVHAVKKVVEEVTLGLDQVQTLIRTMGGWAAETVADHLPGTPDSFELEFGLKLTVKSGHLVGVIVEAGGEGSLVVRMGWDLATRRKVAASQGSGPVPPAVVVPGDS
jgi:Trypsin-co-occurring domain 1